jgi:glycosyltransferase involved in cell wall biosynthesis
VIAEPMIPVAFCIPGDLSQPTGGYRYDREVLARLEQRGLAATHVRLSARYPNPAESDLAETRALLSGLDRKTILLMDGLAAGAMPPSLLSELPHRKVALVHHPLGLEAGLAPERAAFLLRNETEVLVSMAHVIATSALTARTLSADFKVPRHRLSVAEPGTMPAQRAHVKGGSVRILSVGAVSERKAYDALIAALAPLQGMDWHLTIAGSLDRAPQAVEQLRAIICDTALVDRVTLTGTVDDDTLNALFSNSDLFAMSSLYEGYGMALAQALSHGLPIVTTSGGAAAETVPDAAAMKVPSGDAVLLSAALQHVMSDLPLRKRMADAAWAAGALLPTWDDTTRDIADALKALA